MNAFQSTFLTEKLLHVIAHASSNGQQLHIFVEARTQQRPLIEKQLKRTFTVEELNRHGNVIAWNYGLFPSEASRRAVKDALNVEV